MELTPVTCKSCGTVFAGNYCNQCGEKIYHAHDKRISHFLEESFHFITHFDSKFFRSFWLMLAKPGFVASEYCDGKRKKYFSPVSMFLVGVVLYLLFPILQGLNIAFKYHLGNNNTLHFYALQHWADYKANAEHITLGQLAEKFDHLSPKFSKVLLLALIPLTGLALALLFRRKRKYFFDHLILAAEINSVLLILVFLILPFLFLAIEQITGPGIQYGDTVIFLSIHALLILGIVTAGFKRFYQIKFLHAFLKALLFIPLYILVLDIYRLIVFSIVMLFI